MTRIPESELGHLQREVSLERRRAAFRGLYPLHEDRAPGLVILEVEAILDRCYAATRSLPLDDDPATHSLEALASQPPILDSMPGWSFANWSAGD